MSPPWLRPQSCVGGSSEQEAGETGGPREAGLQAGGRKGLPTPAPGHGPAWASPNNPFQVPPRDAAGSEEDGPPLDPGGVPGPGPAACVGPGGPANTPTSCKSLFWALSAKVLA